LNGAEKFLVLLSQDAISSDTVLRALTRVLGVRPAPVKFDKELLNEFFPLETARRLVHLDPKDNVRRSIAGETEALRAYEQHIDDLEQSCSRPGAIYEEVVNTEIRSGLGVTCNEGRIYLLKTLPASVIRDWGTQRFPELVAALRQRDGWANGLTPHDMATASPVIRKLTSLDTNGKAMLMTLCQALRHIKNQGVTTASVPLNVPSLDFIHALRNTRVQPLITGPCPQCDHLVVCPHCHSGQFELKGQSVWCKECRKEVTSGDQVSLRCDGGHEFSRPLHLMLGFFPRAQLLKNIADELRNTGLEWDSTIETFYVEDDMLHYLQVPQGGTVEYIKNVFKTEVKGNMTGSAIGNDNRIGRKLDLAKEEDDEQETA
jgi:hypothetical protein